MDAGGKDAAAVTTVREDVCDSGFFATLELGASDQDCHNSMSNIVVNHQIKPNDDQVSSIKIMKLYAVSFNAPWL